MWAGLDLGKAQTFRRKREGVRLDAREAEDVTATKGDRMSFGFIYLASPYRVVSLLIVALWIQFSIYEHNKDPFTL